MPTSLGQNGGEGHSSFGEDPYQLLGMGLKADHDQLFVVVAVSGAVICPDMHDDVLCVCPRRLVQQAGRNVSRCGSSNCSDMQVASGVKPLSVYMSKVGVANQERREPALLWQSQCRRRLSCAVQSWGVGCGGVTASVTADVEVCGVLVVATVCGVWVALEVRVCVVQVVAEVMMRGV